MRYKMSIKKNIGIGLVVLVALFVFAAWQGSKLSQSKTSNKTSTTQVANKTDPKVSTNPKVSLASQVQAAYLSAEGYKSLDDLHLDANNVGEPYNEIVSFTNDGSGNVDVRVQSSITDQQAIGVGNVVMSIAGPNLKDLKYVTVQDYVGKDVRYVTRSGVGLTD